VGVRGRSDREKREAGEKGGQKGDGVRDY